jgi:RNA polymerase primary sigma factor
MRCWRATARRARRTAGDEDDDTPNDESRARASARRDALRDALATLRGALHAQGCRSAEYRRAQPRGRAARRAWLGRPGRRRREPRRRCTGARARNAAGDAGTDAACFDAPARRALGAALRDGQQKLGDGTRAMLEANLRLVLSIARKYVNRGVDLPDLAGRLPRPDARDREVRIPARLQVLDLRDLVDSAGGRARGGRPLAHDPRAGARRRPVAARSGMRCGFRQRHGRRATPAELAADTGLAEDKLRALLALPAEPLSLDTPLPDAETGLVDLIEDQTSASPFERLANTRMRECVSSLLRSVTPTEADVLRRRRFGLGGAEPDTYDAIAQDAGMSRERVRQIEKRALATLRTAAQAEGAQSFLDA